MYTCTSADKLSYAPGEKQNLHMVNPNVTQGVQIKQMFLCLRYTTWFKVSYGRWFYICHNFHSTALVIEVWYSSNCYACNRSVTKFYSSSIGTFLITFHSYISYMWAKQRKLSLIQRSLPHTSIEVDIL